MLTALVLAALGVVSTPKYPASSVYAAQAELFTELQELYPTVDVTIGWAPCLEENGFYDPGAQHITLCTEMELYPDAALGMVAHEFAHAVEHQILGYTTEQEADELGTLMMIRLHKPSAMIANGLWLRGLDDGKQLPGDPHPGTAFRLWEISCIVDGYLDEGPAECKSLYEGLKLRYDQRLAAE